MQIISASDRLSLHKREDARNRQPAPGMYYEKVYSKIVFYYWSMVLFNVQMSCSSSDKLSIKQTYEETMLKK